MKYCIFILLWNHILHFHSLIPHKKKSRWLIKVFNSICSLKSSWTVSTGAPLSIQHLYQCCQSPGKTASTKRQCWMGWLQEVKGGVGGEGSLLSTSFQIKNGLPQFLTNIQQRGGGIYYCLEPFSSFNYSSSQASSSDACTILIKQHLTKRTSSLWQERKLLRGLFLSAYVKFSEIADWFHRRTVARYLQHTLPCRTPRIQSGNQLWLYLSVCKGQGGQGYRKWGRQKSRTRTQARRYCISCTSLSGSNQQFN